jgi:hypothetical protein
MQYPAFKLGDYKNEAVKRCLFISGFRTFF